MGAINKERFMSKPAARLGDKHVCSSTTSKGTPITSGSPDVFIGNQPAARVGDTVACGTPPAMITTGSSSVFINGRPAARMLDGTSCGGVIIEGLGTVLIGGGSVGAPREGEADKVAPCSPNCGNPVNPILGAKLLPATADFALPAPAPFVFSRGYVSNNAQVGILGQGWSVTGNNLKLTLEPPEPDESNEPEDPDALAASDPTAEASDDDSAAQPKPSLILQDAHGRRIRFTALESGCMAFSDTEQFWLARGGLWSPEDHPLQHPAFQGLNEIDTLNDTYYFVSTGQRVYLLKPGSVPDSWQLAAEYTHQGYCTQYQRDAAGNIQQVIDSAGRRYHFHYQSVPALQDGDPGVRLTSVSLLSDHLQASTEVAGDVTGGVAGDVAGGVVDSSDDEAVGTLVTFSYNASGDLIAVHDRANRIVIQYQWQSHILIGYTVPGRLTMRYEWSENTPEGKVLRQIEVDGLTRTYDYQPTHTSVSDNLGREERYAFVGSGPDLRWHAHHRADGSELHFNYNGDGQRISEIDPLGGVTSFSHDRQGHLSSLRLPTGQIYTYRRDPLGRLTKVTTPDNAVHQYTYDERGNLTSIIDANEHTTRFEYRCAGLPDRPTKRVDPEGATHSYTWTPLGQLASITDCSGQTTQYAYNALGQLIRITDPLKQITEFAYNTVGQRISVTLPDRTQLTYTYNEHGLLTQASDAKGVYQTLRYDDQGQVIAETDANGHTRQYRYDIAGRLTEIINAQGASYHFEYDVMDRVVREVGFDGRERRYTYNRCGDLIQQQEVVNAETHTTQMYYDGVGRLLARELPATELSPTLLEQYRYDAAGRMIQADNIYARVEWAYDPTGARLIEQQWHKNAHLALQYAEANPPEHNDQLLPPLTTDLVVWEWRNETEYNAQGIPRISQQGEHAMGALLYGSGHLLALRLGNLEMTLEPDALHREQQRQIKAKTDAQTNSLTQPLIQRERRYSPVGLLAAQRDVYLGGRLPLSDRSDPIQINQYQYDARYRLSGITQSVPPLESGQPLITQQTQAFQYDPSGHLIGSSCYSPQHPTRNTEQHYTLDKEGNRVGSGAHADPSACHSNRLEQLGHTQFRYDDAGNLIERRAPQDLQTLQYDGLHRLSCVERQRPGYPTTKTYYIYDALSRRICKQIIPERSQSHSIRYGWDGDQLVHEDNGDQRTTVFYEPGSFVPLFRVDETKRSEEFDEHWMLKTPQESASEPGYDTHYSAFVTDHLGTPLKLLGSDGHLLWTAKPDDWCAVRDERAVPDLKQPIRFQGQWLDEETGLCYNRYRYYDPRQGRYITQDPIGLAGGMNSYAYVENSPLMYVDTRGLSRARPVQRRQKVNPWNEFQRNNKGKYNRETLSRLYRKMQLEILGGPKNPELHFWLEQLPENSVEELRKSLQGVSCREDGYCEVDVKKYTCFYQKSNIEACHVNDYGPQMRLPLDQDPSCFYQTETIRFYGGIL